MSLTSTNTITARRYIPGKVLSGVAAALTAAVVIGVVANLQSTETQGAIPAAQQLARDRFVELNTTAMPQIASVDASSPHAQAALDRFVEINTVELPVAGTSAVDKVSEEFRYWNVDAFGPTTTLAPAVGASPARGAGPR